MTVVLIAYDGAYLAVRRAIILTIWSPMRTGADPAVTTPGGPARPC